MVYNSINGFAHTKRITEMKLGSVTERTALEVIAMYDYTKNSDAHEHARKLFNKEEKLEFGSGEDILNGEKREYLGKYDPDKPFTITISEKMLGAKTQEEYAKIAAVAAHEGDHLNGEHIEANAYGQSLDVYTQVVRNLGLKGDSNFALGMIAGMMLPENQRPNAGGVEYFDIDFKNKIIGFEMSDQKDISITSAISKKYPNFTFVGKQKNKDMTLLIGDQDEFNKFFLNQMTHGIKKGLIDYDSGSADITDNWSMNIARAFIGFNCTGGDFFVGAYLDGPSMNFGHGHGIDSKLGSVHVILGFKDSSFTAQAFAYGTEISGHIDRPIPLTDYSLRFEVSKYPLSYGIGGSIGMDTSLFFGFGSTGYGAAIKLLQQ